jgi:uncharacterized phage-associated protein
MMMRFNFQKALQASAVLLNAVRWKRMSYMRLLKLLYIANRESLKETGRVIVPDHFVAMKNGPVLSGLLDVIKDQHPLSRFWNKYVIRSNYEIELQDDPGNDLLSRHDVAKLTAVAEAHQAESDWDIVELTHQFPEWASKAPGDSSVPIQLEDILKAIGRGDQAEEIVLAAKESAAFDEIFTARSPC